MTDMVTQLIFDVDELRKEIISVFPAEGWSKGTLYQLKLLDSILKESQRLKPVSMVSLQRMATDNFVFSDGLVVPKGTDIAVSNLNMRSPEHSHYPNAGEFDPYRYYKLRQSPSQEHWTQFASTSPQHFGFGHGREACPGRYLASNEVKILMCHMLLKYDLKLIETGRPKPIANGFELRAHPTAKIMVRRRESASGSRLFTEHLHS